MFTGLARGDWLQIRRDPVLVMTALLPLLMALVVKFAVPAAGDWLWRTAHFDLMPHLPFVTSIALLMTPLTAGMLAGFLLLDERDQGIIVCLSITPLRKKGYFLYRIGMPAFIAFVLSNMLLILVDMEPAMIVSVLPTTVLACLSTPITALLMAVLAGNKVEGVAVSKAASALMIGPVAGYVLEGGWSYAAGIVPQFWFSKAFVSVSEGDPAWLTLALGYVLHGGLLLVLYRAFIRRSN